MLGKKLGKKAMLLGALAQSIPDFDFLASFWSNASTYLLAHRGFTHSIVFTVLATIVLALVSVRFDKQQKVSYQRWVLFFAVQMSVHLFIDLFNAYGDGLLEPFSHKRYSFNALFVVDLFFSITLAVASAMLLFLRTADGRRVFWQRVGLIIPVLYLQYCVFNKVKIDHDVRKILAEQKVAPEGYFTTPTPLNNFLWYVVVKTGEGYKIGYRSVFDRTIKMDFTYFPKNNQLQVPVADNEEMKQLIRFSQDYYVLEERNDTIVFSDLRFGQAAGWYDPRASFVFQYYLGKGSGSNKLAVQRGRFANWNLATTKSLIKRIGGD
jgi:inner membrane protein